jgi:curli biogenesis system outer membrane secretion channel CsgG
MFHWENQVKMSWHRYISASLIVLCLCSCKKKPAPTVDTSPSNVAGTSPDVGKVDTVSTSADGYGPTPAAATADAMKTAILQVNGATINTGSIQAKFGLDATDGQDAVSLRASAFAELIAEKSGGAITNFKVKSMEEPTKKGGSYKVTIEANIAHFTPPTDKKIKVVVAPVRFDRPNIIIGSSSVSSQKVAQDIQQQVSTALTETGRFSVLDRDSTPEITQELDMIDKGEAPRAESGKVGQAVTADVIWVGHIQSLAYNRNARQLETSDRELVSFSGGWVVSEKLVNVATRQIMLSSSLQGEAPGVAATTLGAGINPDQVLSEMESSIAKAAVTSIIAKTFPISIIERNGNSVILSQGGQSIKLGGRYSVIAIGREMKDPQTGESLGRSSSPCCEVVIDRVAEKLSYGHLENVATSLEGLPLGALQIDGPAKLRASPAGSGLESNQVTKVAQKSRGVVIEESDSPAKPTKKEDGKW